MNEKVNYGKYLVINAGSTSLKFQLLEMPQETVIAKGTVERINTEGSCWKFDIKGEKVIGERPLPTHVDAAKVVLDVLLENEVIKDLSEIMGIGHRVVHGGEYYDDSVVITDDVVGNIRKLELLAPLHNPAQAATIESFRKLLPDVTQVASFDTAFHQTMPKEKFMYGVPRHYYTESGIRRFGAHGTNYKYIVSRIPYYTGKYRNNVGCAHAGGGYSFDVIKANRSFNTTMGLTPNEGPIMMRRSGTIPASVVKFRHDSTGQPYDGESGIFEDLDKRSGFYGLTGMDDYRDVEKGASEGDEYCQLALTMFHEEVVNNILRGWRDVGYHYDIIIFTGGIGENSAAFRKDIINSLPPQMQIELDDEANESIASFKEKHEGTISTPESRVKVAVIPANEELMIARDTFYLANGIELENDDFSFEELDLRIKMEQEKYSLSLISFYISQYLELYWISRHELEVEEINRRQEEAIESGVEFKEQAIEITDCKKIFKRMCKNNSQLEDDFVNDMQCLGHEGEDFGDIIVRRLEIIRKRREAMENTFQKTKGLN